MAVDDVALEPFPGLDGAAAEDHDSALREPVAPMEQKTFNQLLAAAVKNGASDIHIKAGAPPALRLQGQLLPVKVPALSPDDARRIAAFLLAAGGFKGDV